MDAPKRTALKMTTGYESNWYGVVTSEHDDDPTTVEYILAAEHDRIMAEKEAEIARLRREIHEASDPDFLLGAMDNVNDMDLSLADFADAAAARSEQPWRTAMSETLRNLTQWGKRYRHKNTGSLYKVLAMGLIESDLTPCVVYESEKDGLVWVRPYTEFGDGRFEEMPDE